MKLLIFNLAALLWLIPLAASPAAETPPFPKPNIVIILADDLGYGDVQCYNRERGKIPTPAIDKFAREGMRFTDAHSSSGVCSPSRYSLLTGRYHWRTRLQTGIVGVFGPPLIAPERMTIGTLARQSGFRTGAIGKWHLGWNWPAAPQQRKFLTLPKKGKAGGDDEAPVAGGVASQAQIAAWQQIFSKPIAGGPTTHGFDTYFGTDVPNWPPYCFIENDRTVGVPIELLPRALLGNNLAALQGPALKDWKLEDILPTIGDRAVKFITDAASKSEPFLLYLPLTAPHTPLAVIEAWKGKSHLTTYADYVMETDATVSRVLAALEKNGAANHTLVVLTSDNGCAPYIGVEELVAKGHYPSGPLRGYKFDVWEGGHRIPFLVRWPGVVRPGTVCGQLVQQTDLFATIAEILGEKVPDNAGEDSFSLLPLLKGTDQPVRKTGVSAAVDGTPGLRLGSWKYIAGSGSGGKSPGGVPSQPVQLYDLASDLGEKKNLATSMPQKVTEMQALLEKLISDGRSTPGLKQENDVPVVRYPRTSAR